VYHEIPKTYWTKYTHYLFNQSLLDQVYLLVFVQAKTYQTNSMYITLASIRWSTQQTMFESI